MGALGIKRFKKSLYLRIASRLGLHRGVTWQVSSVHELADTRTVIAGEPAFFIKAPDILDPVSAIKEPRKVNKVPGEARFVFVSRIAPIKNLDWAIQRLAGVSGNVKFTIFGPAEDKAYWSVCEAAIRELPTNVRCEHLGPVPSSEVVAKLSEHQFFLFPTQGENFGHVIAEALTSGCPVLLSDRAPWRDLDDANAGWVMPLEDPAEWEQRIQSCVDMDATEFAAMSESARAYICRLAAASADGRTSLAMFESVLSNEAAA
jgi:glycosyltransferase involved in cell wall biosynthesis